MPVVLGEQLLLNVKMGEPTNALEYSLQKLDMGDLTGSLISDNTKKAFWINIYNAYFQILSVRERKTKPHIFKQRLIPIAGRVFCLDDIEHSILRRYRWKFGLGYLSQLFPLKIIQQLAVSNIDFRIHFALNCGAKSCPPIAFYEADSIDKQLYLATQSFLENETVINEPKKTVSVTKLMQWFRADFGGITGIKKILAQYLKKDFTGYTMHYTDYNWSQQLNKFAQ